MYGGIIRPMLHCTISGTLPQNPDLENFLLHADRRNVLSTLLDKGGRSQRNKLDRRRSTIS